MKKPMDWFKRTAIVAGVGTICACGSTSADEAVGKSEARLEAIPASNKTKRALGVEEWRLLPNEDALEVHGVGAGGAMKAQSQMHVYDGDDARRHLTFDMLGDKPGRFEMAVGDDHLLHLTGAEAVDAERLKLFADDVAASPEAAALKAYGVDSCALDWFKASAYCPATVLTIGLSCIGEEIVLDPVLGTIVCGGTALRIAGAWGISCAQAIEAIRSDCYSAKTEVSTSKKNCYWGSTKYYPGQCIVNPQCKGTECKNDGNWSAATSCPMPSHNYCR